MTPEPPAADRERPMPAVEEEGDGGVVPVGPMTGAFDSPGRLRYRAHRAAAPAVALRTREAE